MWLWGVQLCILQRQQPGYLCTYEAQGKPLIKDWKHFWTLFHVHRKEGFAKKKLVRYVGYATVDSSKGNE